MPRRRRAGCRALPRARGPAPARACGRRPRRRSARRRRDHRRAARRPRRAGHRPGAASSRPPTPRASTPRSYAASRRRMARSRRTPRSSRARSACRRPWASATPCSRSTRARRCCSTATPGRCWSTLRPTSWPPPRSAANAATARRAAALERAGEPGAMRDGARVEVFANLGSAAEAGKAVELGAEGVGLLRTEFLFLDRAQLPDEDEQAETLREIARALDGRPLVVRTLDAGADKPLPALPMPSEANPFLGVRGIRLGAPAPGDPLHAAARHPARGGRVPGQGDAPDGGHARARCRPRARCSTRRGPPPASTRRSNWGSWSRSPPPR